MYMYMYTHTHTHCKHPARTKDEDTQRSGRNRCPCLLIGLTEASNPDGARLPGPQAGTQLSGKKPEDKTHAVSSLWKGHLVAKPQISFSVWKPILT